MTILLLRRVGDQSIPRPWNRASSTDEVVEMIEAYAKTKGQNALVYLDYINTEHPIAYVVGDCHFYAFEERF